VDEDKGKKSSEKRKTRQGRNGYPVSLRSRNVAVAYRWGGWETRSGSPVCGRREDEAVRRGREAERCDRKSYRRKLLGKSNGKPMLTLDLGEGGKKADSKTETVGGLPKKSGTLADLGLYDLPLARKRGFERGKRGAWGDHLVSVGNGVEKGGPPGILRAGGARDGGEGKKHGKKTTRAFRGGGFVDSCKTAGRRCRGASKTLRARRHERQDGGIQERKNRNP